MICPKPMIPIMENQMNIIGPKSLPTTAVPKRCTANNATTMHKTMGTVCKFG